MKSKLIIHNSVEIGPPYVDHSEVTELKVRRTIHLVEDHRECSGIKQVECQSLSEIFRKWAKTFKGFNTSIMAIIFVGAEPDVLGNPRGPLVFSATDCRIEEPQICHLSCISHRAIYYWTLLRTCQSRAKLDRIATSIYTLISPLPQVVSVT